jgi:hypothetical protein
MCSMSFVNNKVIISNERLGIYIPNYSHAQQDGSLEYTYLTKVQQVCFT